MLSSTTHANSTVTLTYNMTKSSKTAINPSFSPSAVTVKFSDDPAEPTLSGQGSGAVTYASSKQGVATVHVNSGVLTLKGVGSTTITATVAETASHAAGTATYTLTVNKDDAPSGASALSWKGGNNGLSEKYDGEFTNAEILANIANITNSGYTIKSISEQKEQITQNSIHTFPTNEGGSYYIQYNNALGTFTVDITLEHATKADITLQNAKFTTINGDGLTENVPININVASTMTLSTAQILWQVRKWFPFTSLGKPQVVSVDKAANAGTANAGGWSVQNKTITFDYTQLTTNTTAIVTVVLSSTTNANSTATLTYNITRGGKIPATLTSGKPGIGTFYNKNGDFTENQFKGNSFKGYQSSVLAQSYRS